MKKTQEKETCGFSLPYSNTEKDRGHLMTAKTVQLLCYPGREGDTFLKNRKRKRNSYGNCVNLRRENDNTAGGLFTESRPLFV